MEKISEPAWVKRVRKSLAQAKKVDSDFAEFGAYQHQYRLASPATEEKLQAFEKNHGITLPEDYRDFLKWMGDGGAGPYYGLYGLQEIEKESSYNDDYQLSGKPVIYPAMSDEAWAELVERKEEEPLYAGILPIGTQGCTLMTGLVLAGEQRGQVVYFDLDLCGQPFFMREKGFLAWYERWLREVIAGYVNEMGFGLNLDGDANELMAAYQTTDDATEKSEIIASFYKFETLPKKQQTYFKQVCADETNMTLRMKLIKMLTHFHVPGMTKEIDNLWAYGAYAEAISIITYEGTWAVKEAWYQRIIDKLPELRGDGFRDACYTIQAMKDYPDVYAGLLRDALLRDDLDKNDRSVLLHCIQDLRDKEDVLDYFLTYLPMEKDPHLLIYAIQAMRDVQDERLRAIYVMLLNKYRTHENALFDYKGSQMVLKGGGCLGAHRPEGQVVSNLLNALDHFGLDYRGAWKLLMDDGRWHDWQKQHSFVKE